MQKKLLIVLLFCISGACFAQLGFHSRYSIPDKNEFALTAIENKLVSALNLAKKSKKDLPFSVYAYTSGWRMEYILSEIMLNEKAIRTNKYELYMEWNPAVDTGYVTGYSNCYTFDVQEETGIKKTVTRPLRTVLLGEYPAFLSPAECAELYKIIRSDLVKKWSLVLSGEHYYSTVKMEIRDSLNSYNTTLLEQLSDKLMGNFEYGPYVFYATPEMANPITNKEKQALTVSLDTTVTENISVFSKTIYTVVAFEIINQWKIKPVFVENGKSGYIPELETCRTITALGLVFSNRKKTYLSYGDFKKLCTTERINFNAYEHLFNNKSIQQLDINYQR